MRLSESVKDKITEFTIAGISFAALFGMLAVGCSDNKSNAPQANANATNESGQQIPDTTVKNNIDLTDESNITYYKDGTAIFEVRTGYATMYVGATCLGNVLVLAQQESYQSALSTIVNSHACNDGRITKGELTELYLHN